jgi:hypothetical protein
VVAPWLFGVLIETGSRDNVLIGYLLGAGLMAGAAMLVLWLGIKSERRPLEEVATPLSWHTEGQIES